MLSPESGATLWDPAPGDRAGPGPQHVLAFLILTLLGTVVGTLGLVGLPMGLELSSFWMAMTLQVAGGVWFGGWGVLAGTLVGVLSNYFNLDLPAYTWGYVPANAFQSALTAWVFRRWKLDPRLPSWKELAIFCAVAVVLANLGGATLAAGALYAFESLPDPENPARFLADWMLGNGLPCLIFGPLLMRAFSPQIAGSPFFCKRWWGGSAPMQWPGRHLRDYPIVARLLAAFGLAGVLPMLGVCVLQTAAIKARGPQPHSYLVSLLLSVSVFLSVIIAGWVAGGMQRRIGVLEEAAQRFGEGDLGHAIPDLGANELGRLGIAMRGMAEDLARSREELRRTTEAQARDRKEMEIAREIQQSFLPQEYPRIPGVTLAARSVPARVVGGDFYDFIPLGEGRWGILIADVSGKGVPAALFTGLSRSLVRVYATETGSVTKALSAFNAYVTEDNPASMFVTLFCASLSPGGDMVCVNAGHNPPLLVRRGGEILPIGATGVPLGLFAEAKYGEKPLQLGEGDTLVLYTDGVTEAFNGAEELFGMERLAEVLKGCAGLPPEEWLERILEAVGSFAQGAPQSDDITVVVLRVVGEGES